jgi:soluble lytic murein transglycosylase-like protein
MKVKPIKSNAKIMKSSSELIAQKLKEIECKKKERAKSRRISKGNLLGKIIACALTAVTIVVAYIYIERQAQAAPDGQNQSRIQVIYELYDRNFSYYKKKIIRDILLNNGVKENLSEQIAETIVEEAKKTNIPEQMYLAIIKKESTFRTGVVSRAYAKGIMQIQGGTWDAYVEKHNLPVTREHMFQPQANIMVASVILKELYDYYAGLGYRKPEVWNYVLAAYFAGPASLKNGLKGYHWRYIEKIKQYYNEFELQIAA